MKTKKMPAILFVVLCVLLSNCFGKTEQAAVNNSNAEEKKEPVASSSSNNRNQAAKASDFGYVINEQKSGVIVTYYTGSATEVTVPDRLDNLPVTGIRGSERLFKGSPITGISLPDTISIIPAEAFRDCKNLRNIKFPANLSSIEASAFRGCTSISSIKLPANLSTIGESAFRGCMNLSGIAMGNSVTRIHAYAFYGNERLTNVTLSENLVTIGNDAFYNCIELTDINVPVTLTTFTRRSSWENVSNAFAWCHKLPLATRDKLITQGYPAAQF